MQQPQKLSEDQQNLLKNLVARIKDEVQEHRLAALERAAECRAFWKGSQYGEFDKHTGSYIDAARLKNPDWDNEDDVYDYVLNLYQANGQIYLGSMLEAGMPGVTFVPGDPDKPRDTDATTQARSIRDFIHRQAWFNEKKKWAATHQLFYDDGVVVAYVRHVRDKRFGTYERPRMEAGMREMRPAGYDCPNPDCRTFTDAGQMNAMAACPHCGSDLSGVPESPAITAQAAVENGTEEVAECRELVDLYGVLETVLPWWTDEVSDCPFVGIEKEVHVGQAREKNPELASEIQPGYTAAIGDEAAQQARAAAQAPGGTAWVAGGEHGEMVTWSRFWLRPAAFYAITDVKERDALLKAFPEGCRVEWAGPKFLTAEPEKMDDHLVIGHAMTGDGMYKPGIGHSFVDVQIMANEAINTQQEAMGKGAFPPVYRDSGLLSDDAAVSNPGPGQDIPIPVPPGKNLSQCVWQPNWKETSTSVQNTLEQSMQLGAILLGTNDAIAGESMENMRTARGYSLAQSAARKRLSPFYVAGAVLWADIDQLLVKQFARNRTENVRYAMPSKTGLEFEAREISIQQAQGEYTATTEATPALPATWEQKATALQNMLQSAGGNPVVMGWLTTPRNLRVIKQAFGVEELQIPGEWERNRTLRIIAELLKIPPILGVPMLDPAAGQMVPGMPQPAIPLDDFLDNPMLTAETVREWALSPDGVREEKSNPDGYQHVLVYGRAALAQANMIMAAQQQAAIDAGQQAASPEEAGGVPPPAKPPRPPPGADQPSIPTPQTGVM